ncbi:Ribosomal protein L25 [Gracilaria domingensis]|nr:Ribosomal protein L25 [Gracilaria domingensis]
MYRAWQAIQSVSGVLQSTQCNHSIKRLRFVASAVRDEAEDISGGVAIDEVNMLDSSDPALFHRRVTGRLREGNKRATAKIRKEGSWILACVEGRNIIPDMILQVPKAPLLEDKQSEEHTVNEYGKVLSTSSIPFERIRVLAHNIRIHPTGEYPLGVSFRYSPENEPVRVRVPMICINREKSPGLREGGWLNRLQKYVDINVAPFTPAPQFVTMDVSGMEMKEKRFVRDLQFERKGEGCRLVLGDDVPVVVVSK